MSKPKTSSDNDINRLIKESIQVPRQIATTRMLRLRESMASHMTPDIQRLLRKYDNRAKKITCWEDLLPFTMKMGQDFACDAVFFQCMTELVMKEEKVMVKALRIGKGLKKGRGRLEERVGEMVRGVVSGKRNRKLVKR